MHSSNRDATGASLLLARFHPCPRFKSPARLRELIASGSPEPSFLSAFPPGTGSRLVEEGPAALGKVDFFKVRSVRDARGRCSDGNLLTDGQAKRAMYADREKGQHGSGRATTRAHCKWAPVSTPTSSIIATLLPIPSFPRRRSRVILSSRALPLSTRVAPTHPCSAG